MASKSKSAQNFGYILFFIVLALGILSIKLLGNLFSWHAWIWEILVIFWILFSFEIFHRYGYKDFPSIVSFLRKTSTLGKLRYLGLILFVFVGLNIFSGLGKFYFRYFDYLTLGISLYLVLYSGVR